jgi:hypothetical protein
VTPKPSGEADYVAVDLDRLKRQLDQPRRHAMLCGPPERSCFKPSCSCWCHSPSESAAFPIDRVTLHNLINDLENARKVLVFADGNCVANSDFALADLYAEDCEWAQSALSTAGCHPRGKIPALRHEADPGEWWPCLNGCMSNAEHFFAHQASS